jgi:DNA-binding NtrC family response regulator
LSGKKVFLLVDDDKDRIEGVKDLFQSRGYIVDTAKTGREAMEKSRSRPYNLALLAFQLAEREGPEFLTSMRKLIPRTNTIMIAGGSSSKVAASLPDLESEGYVIEPFDPENLLKTVEDKLKEQAEVELYRSVIPWTKP